jgi:hypothetical protein
MIGWHLSPVDIRPFPDEAALMPQKRSPQPLTRTALVLGVSLLTAFPAAAQDEPPIATDRPSESAAASLVPLRQVQLEAGMRWTTNEAGDRFDVGEILLRWRAASAVELRLGLNSHAFLDGPATNAQGLEDTDLSVKIPVYHSGTGSTLLTLLPRVTLPTGDSEVGGEGATPGLDVLIDHALDSRWSLTSNVGWEHDGVSERRFDQLKGTLLLNYSINDRWGAYAEVYGFNREEAGGDAASYFDAGASYLLGRKLVLNGVLGTGLSGTDTDYFLGVGVGKRW